MASPTTQCPKCGEPADDQGLGGLCFRCVALEFLKPEGLDRALMTEPADGLDGSPLARFGDYELVEEIARGGMGVVYRARQLRLGREVAVKFLLDGVLAGDTAVARFLEEARAAAALRHPHIVAIHEVGETQERHYFSMEFVRGRTLAELVRSGPLPAARAAGYLAKVATAVQFAHAAGVLHRDLKPSNVLVDEHDEPRVTDFGLAKRSDAGEDLTLSGQVLGTPAYISPEQAGAGRTSAVDERSDVYSLGAVLYHLLAGRPPFTGDSATAVLRQVAETEPLSPWLLNPSVPRDLETVCLQCLAKKPSDRYATAAAFAADLERFLRDEPVVARPPGIAEKAARWCRRRPALAAALAIIAALVATVLTVSIRSTRRMDELRRHSLTNLYASDMRLTQQAITEGHYGAASELLARYRSPSTDPDLRHFEWRHFAGLCRSDETATLGSHDAQVQRMVFSPDGRILASASGRILAWELPSQRRLPDMTANDFIWALGVSPDSRELIAGDHSGTMLRFEAASGRKLGASTSPTGLPLAFAWPATASAPLAISGGGMQVWDPQAAAPPPVVPTPAGVARAFVSPDGGRAALLIVPGQAAVWNLNPPAEAYRIPLSFPSRALALLSGTNQLAAGDYSGHLHIIDRDGRHPERILNAHRGMIECLAVSLDGTRLASAGADQIVRVWDTATWESVGQWHGHKSLIFSLAFSPEGRWLASGDRTGEVKLWNLVERSHAAVILGGPLGFLADDGSRLVTRRTNGSLAVRPSVSAPESDEVIPPMAFDMILVGESAIISRDSKGRASRLAGDKVWRPLEAPSRIGLGMGALSRTGRYLFAVNADDAGGTIWDLDASRRVVELPMKQGWVSPTFSRDETLAAHGYMDGHVFLYELPSGRLRGSIQAHVGFSYSCAFSGDGRYLATAGFDSTVRLWDTATLQRIAEFRSTADSYWCVGVSPDGRRVAAGTGDSAIAVWDVPSRLEVAHFNLGEPLRPVEGTLRFSPDGNALVRAGVAWNVWLAEPVAGNRSP